MITTGVRFVDKANMWCTYLNYNIPKKTNEIFWFSDHKDAEKKLESFNEKN